MSKPEDMGPPNLSDTFREVIRATKEWKYLVKHWDKLKEQVPSGNGEAVMILPGFSNGDFSNKYLIKFLEEIGYTVYGWENGVNIGLNQKTAEHLEKRLDELYQKHGKVRLIGHSLGGIFAREMAREHPEKVEMVITIGSPFGAVVHPNSAAFGIRAILSLLDPKNVILSGDELHDRALTPPPNIPITSIYTKTDGIVNWRTCINPDTSDSENVRVLGSHSGLIANLSALLVVADRLSQKASNWKPFDLNDHKSDMTSRIREHKGFTPDLPEEYTLDKGPKLF